MAFVNAKIFGRFYSPERVLSYGRHFVFCLGSRSVGKSTGWALYVLMQYLKYGKKFIYQRRTMDETRETCETYFDNAVDIINRHEPGNIAAFKYDKGDYYLTRDGETWEQCGTIAPLSMTQKMKSMRFTEYCYIIYDEFIADDGRYLGGYSNPRAEYLKVLNFYMTVDRGIDCPYRNETTYIFIGNNSSYFNPLFIYLGITRYIRTDSKIIAPKGAAWILEQIGQVDATAGSQSVIASLADDAFNKYAFENDSGELSAAFVGKVKDVSRPIVNLKFEGDLMGVYYTRDRKIYISTKTNNCKTLALTMGDQNEIDYNAVLSRFMDPVIDVIYSQMMAGNVLYETPKIKYNMTNFYRLTHA